MTDVDYLLDTFDRISGHLARGDIKDAKREVERIMQEFEPMADEEDPVPDAQPRGMPQVYKARATGVAVMFKASFTIALGLALGVSLAAVMTDLVRNILRRPDTYVVRFEVGQRTDPNYRPWAGGAL